MKRSFMTVPFLLTLVLTVSLSLFSACQRSSQYSGFSDGGDDENYPQGGKAPKTTLPQGPKTQQQAAVPSQVQTCFSLSNRAVRVAQQCYSYADDADFVSDACANAIGALNDARCSGLTDRVNRAKSLCSSVIAQRNRAPAACQSAIAAIM